MAKLIINGTEVTVEDGQKIADVCEENGIPFGCGEGACGTCVVKVESGADNLNPPTEEEVDFDLDDGTRLACQCKIMSGTVSISD